MPGKPIVIVIDDDDDLRESLHAMLEDNGFEVACYDGALSYLADLSRHDASVVVSDFQMPGMTGLDLIRALRQRGAETPVILITAYATDAVRALGDKAGVVSLWEKPFDPLEFIRSVKAIADRR